MTKTLYVAVGFVGLHQKNPGFSPGNNSGNPLLSVGGQTISVRKYGLEVGNGDPGENPNFDTFDYSEFAVVGAVLGKPYDYHTRSYYMTENGQAGFQKWYTITVPDNFQVPNGLDSGIPLADNDDNAATGFLPGYWVLSGGDAHSRPYLLDESGNINGISETAPVFLNGDAARSYIANGFKFAFDTVIKNIASGMGVSSLYTAISNAGKFQNAVSDFYENASSVLNTLLRDGASSRMSDTVVIEQVDGLLRNSRDAFMDAAIAVSGGSNYSRAIDITRTVMTMNESGVQPTRFFGFDVYADPYWEGTAQQPIERTAVIIIDGGGDYENPIKVRADRAMISAGDGDDLIESEGNGKVIAFGDEGSDRIFTFGGNDRLYGGIGQDWIVSGEGNDIIYGNDGNDELLGQGGNDTIYGGAGTDSISGGEGINYIRGGTGADRLFNGEGVDYYRFYKATELKDKVYNYFGGFDTKDEIQLEGSAFGFGSYAGPLARSAFHSSSNNLAHDTSDRIIFRTTDDTLWYDSNGSVNGGTRLLILDFHDNVNLKYTDIVIF